MQVQQQPTNQDNAIDLMINMGPQHPSTHGVFRLVIWVDGERIVKAEPHIGYLHRGSEKLCEDELYSQVITLFDRLDYVANLNCELAFCMAVEKLMEIEVPERAQYIRTIFCELNRIASHMLFYGVYGMDAGAVTPILYGFRERERIQSLFESVTGARMMHNYFRVGGVNEELPDDFEQRLSKLTDELKQGIDECDGLLSQNEMFLARTKGIGTISGPDAIAFGVTGPALRASGVLEDVRISEPYGIYDRFDYGIPVGSQGDCWDRYYVRVRELEECIKIIRHARDALPRDGDVHAALPKKIRPKAGHVYSRTESPRGDLGYYIASDGSDIPTRIKMRSPAFTALSWLNEISRGWMISDGIAILGSLDIVLGEIDR